MRSNQKLYLITRRDLSPGAQLAQTCHALTEFALEFPNTFKEWKDTSNYICILSAENESELDHYLWMANMYNLEHSVFHEPDLDNELTAICLEPTEESEDICKSLPLALNEYNETRW